MSERQQIARLFKSLSTAPRLPFPSPGGRLDAPCTHGVYVIRDPAGHAVHVGRTPRGRKGLRQRLGNHLHNASSFTRKHLKGNGALLRRGYTYQCLEVEDSRKRALLEAYAIGWLCPEHLGLHAAPPARKGNA